MTAFLRLVWFHVSNESRPPVVFGEQVSATATVGGIGADPGWRRLHLPAAAEISQSGSAPHKR